jgi:hypothetical protein
MKIENYYYMFRQSFTAIFREHRYIRVQRLYISFSCADGILFVYLISNTAGWLTYECRKICADATTNIFLSDKYFANALVGHGEPAVCLLGRWPVLLKILVFWYILTDVS